MIEPVEIRGHLLGPNRRCLIVAEAGVNHNGNVNLAHQLVAAAHASGVDAVKFQSFTAADLVTPEALKAEYQAEPGADGQTQYEMLRALELRAADQAALKDRCDELGLLYLCTPYARADVDLLDEMDVAAFKIGSTDTNNSPFLRYVASKRRPVILSTGMSSLGEVDDAVRTLREGGLDGRIILLHCASAYPAPLDALNLRTIATMRARFGCPVGFSDHTAGVGAAPWAVAFGTCLIEKHFTLDKQMRGPDHRASVDPKELSALVRAIRDVESALGDGEKRVMAAELSNKSRMQKSLVAARDIKAGERFTADMLVCKRPATGLAPASLAQVLGSKAARDLARDTVLQPTDLARERGAEGM